MLNVCAYCKSKLQKQLSQYIQRYEEFKQDMGDGIDSHYADLIGTT
jgi:hypothetical protein